MQVTHQNGNKKDITVYQNNAITEARYDMSALQKNIFYLLLTQISPFDKELMGKEYRLSISDINRNRDVRVRKLEVIKSANDLINKGLVLYDINQKKFISVGILASSKYAYDTVSKRETLVLKFDPKIAPFLFNVKKRFTVFTLAYALKLDSKYSKRIYEMLSQFSSTGVFRVSVQELKERFEIADLKTGKDKYPKFGNFARDVLNVALKEINEHTDITFHYTTKKTGRKVTDLEFHIKPNSKRETVILPESIALDSETIALRDILTTRYQLSSKLIEDVLASISCSAIRKTIYDIQLANSDHKIRNLTAYTAKIFQNKLEEIRTKPLSEIAHTSDNSLPQTSMIDHHIQVPKSSPTPIGEHITQILSPSCNISAREIKFFGNSSNFDHAKYAVWKNLYMHLRISQPDIDCLMSEYPFENLQKAIEQVSQENASNEQETSAKSSEQNLQNIIRKLNSL